MLLQSILVVLTTISAIYTENIYLLDIEPTKARQLIQNRIVPLKPKYANLVRANVPVLRNIDGKQIELNENVYEAVQAHGQDGEGSYGYMYSNPNDAKVETRYPNGEVHGMYQYRLPDGQEVVVKYFGDENGIQITDNLNHEPVKETDEVRNLRLQHEKAVQEAINRIENAKSSRQKSYESQSKVYQEEHHEERKYQHQQQEQQQQQQHQQQQSYEFKDYKKGEPLGAFSEQRETKTSNPELVEEEVVYVPRGSYYETSHLLNSLSDESYSKLRSL